MLTKLVFGTNNRRVIENELGGNQTNILNATYFCYDWKKPLGKYSGTVREVFPNLNSEFDC